MLKLLCVTLLILSVPAWAHPSIAQESKCSGPVDLCNQIFELRAKLEAQEKLVSTKNQEIQTKETEKTQAVETKETEKVQAIQTEVKTTANNATRLIAFAALFAVILKLAISVVKSWKSYFTSDKGRAWLKISTLAMGLAALLLTNIGFGLPFWQSLIVAGGGPGAMVIHDIVGLIPVLLGKKPMPPSASDVPPSNPPDGASPEDQGETPAA